VSAFARMTKAALADEMIAEMRVKVGSERRRSEEART